MNQSLVTVIIPIDPDPDRVAPLNKTLDNRSGELVKELVKATADRPFVHFLSMVAIPAPDYTPRKPQIETGFVAGLKSLVLWLFLGLPRLYRWFVTPKAHLIIEVNADGKPEEVLKRLADAIPKDLSEILRKSGHPIDEDRIEKFLCDHRHEFKPHFPFKPGLLFQGTPDMSVERILAEDKLALAIQAIVDGQKDGSALQRLWKVRDEIFKDSKLKECFVPEPVKKVVGDANPIHPLALAWIGIRQFGWPLLLVPLPVLALALVTYSVFPSLWITTLFAALVVALVVALVARGYRELRQSEDDDVPLDKEPNEKELAEILEREGRDGAMQNHLTAVSTMKDGWYRRVSLRGALWLIGESGAKRSKPGYIDKIGTIHFARWFRLPGTNQLIFLSNYDGSWQSYLEDFIARLREGLSSVWSNTVDFPKTTNLIAGGAGDGSRFKRWARRQQHLTRIWYSAYPHLTNDRIRANAMIRHGFASAATEEAAARWLSLFGYAARESLEMREIPVLAFGGLRSILHSQCLMVSFKDAQAPEIKAWVRSIAPQLSYGDAVPADEALALGFSRHGLEKLGLGPAAIATFPIAFQQGMQQVGRACSLGDDEPEKWLWGDSTTHALLIVYRNDAKTLDSAVEAMRKEIEERRKFAVTWTTKFTPLPAGKGPVIEPFGFRDGVSQPVVSGTLRASRERNLANVVRAGELVLGYRDNLDILAPVPRALGEDIGRNGTYLVVRQLEQNTVAFDNYLKDTATKLAKDKDVRPPTQIVAELKDWLAAKMVGRWKDGSSLIRNPHMSATDAAPKGSPPPAPDNRFMYGHEDPDGLRCPLGSHIRRANPRDSLEAGSEKQIEISNRHRILRVGRSYEPQKGLEKKGLMFMCVNADIERQFEFLQQSWILGPNFHGLADEIDPIVGSPKKGGCCAMTVPTPNGPLRLKGLGNFVKMQGGGYFFMASRSTVDFLTRGAAYPVGASVPDSELEIEGTARSRPAAIPGAEHAAVSRGLIGPADCPAQGPISSGFSP